MIKKTITYTNMFDEEVTEDFYFHIFEHELLELEASEKTGFSDYIKRAIAAEDRKTLLRQFRNIVDISFGERTPEGGFKKTPELLAEFRTKQAYSDLYIELATDEDKAVEFIRGVVPAKLQSAKKKMTAAEFRQMSEQHH